MPELFHRNVLANVKWREGKQKGQYKNRCGKDGKGIKTPHVHIAKQMNRFNTKTRWGEKWNKFVAVKNTNHFQFQSFLFLCHVKTNSIREIPRSKQSGDSIDNVKDKKFTNYHPLVFREYTVEVRQKYADLLCTKIADGDNNKIVVAKTCRLCVLL